MHGSDLLRQRRVRARHVRVLRRMVRRQLRHRATGTGGVLRLVGLEPVLAILRRRREHANPNLQRRDGGANVPASAVHGKPGGHTGVQHKPVCGGGGRERRLVGVVDVVAVCR